VGSRAQRSAAESLLQNYRESFAAQDRSAGILSAEIEGETRYRIGVGQFDTRSEAQDFIEQAGNNLPEGAWILRL